MIAARSMIRRYYGAEGSPAFARSILHNEHDARVSTIDLIAELLDEAQIEDGDYFTIRIEGTGQTAGRRVLHFCAERKDRRAPLRIVGPKRGPKRA